MPSPTPPAGCAHSTPAPMCWPPPTTPPASATRGTPVRTAATARRAPRGRTSPRWGASPARAAHPTRTRCRLGARWPQTASVLRGTHGWADTAASARTPPTRTRLGMAVVGRALLTLPPSVCLPRCSPASATQGSLEGTADPATPAQRGGTRWNTVQPPASRALPTPTSHTLR
eukprot:454057-Hanusia_phi.AAC.2